MVRGEGVRSVLPPIPQSTSSPRQKFPRGEMAGGGVEWHPPARTRWIPLQRKRLGEMQKCFGWHPRTRLCQKRTRFSGMGIALYNVRVAESF